MVPKFEFMHNADGSAKLVVGEITITAGFACNIQCYGCSTTSNYKIHDPYTLTDRLNWLESLAEMFRIHNLTVGRICIGGGEPFMTLDTIDIIKKIAEIFPDSMEQHSIVTNGLLVRRNIAILDAVQEYNIMLGVSTHRTDAQAQAEYEEVFKLLETRGIKPSIKKIGATLPWHLSFNKDENGKYIPANANFNRSWATCKLKDCIHLYDYRLLKCPRIAYIDRTLSHTNQLDDPAWQQYRKYKGIDCRTATLDDVITFFSTGPEAICSMCEETSTFYSGKPVFHKDYDSFDFEDKKMFTFRFKD